MTASLHASHLAHHPHPANDEEEEEREPRQVLLARISSLQQTIAMFERALEDTSSSSAKEQAMAAELVALHQQLISLNVKNARLNAIVGQRNPAAATSSRSSSSDGDQDESAGAFHAAGNPQRGKLADLRQRLLLMKKEGTAMEAKLK